FPGRMAAAVPESELDELAGCGACLIRRGGGRVLRAAGREAAGARADLVYVGSGAIVLCRRADPGCAAVWTAKFYEAGFARRILVSAEGHGVHLPVYVGALHAAALPLRPVDAPGLVHPDSPGDCERTFRGRSHDPGIGIWMESLAGADCEHGPHAGGRALPATIERQARRGGFIGRASRRAFNRGFLCWIRSSSFSLREWRSSAPP